MNSIAIKPFGEQAILIEWPNRVDESILQDILQFSEHLKRNYLKPTDWEFVPAYNSLALISKNQITEFEALQDDLLKWYSDKKDSLKTDRFLWDLPVCYNTDYGMDLEEISELLKLSIPDLVALHTEHHYTVYGIGFLPGFMYLGGLPQRLETPRRSTPPPSGLQGVSRFGWKTNRNLSAGIARRLEHYWTLPDTYF